MASSNEPVPNGATEIVPMPKSGRVFSLERRVRLGDITPKGRLRLDAVARYLQDIASDDTVDAGLAEPLNWVVRRTLIEVHQAPVFEEMLTLSTFCGGYGSRWAERRTQLLGENGGHIETATVWVCFDAKTRRPRKVSQEFIDIFASPAGARMVKARNELPTPTAEARTEPWPLRFVDFDILAHLNNATYWAAVEEIIGRRSMGGRFVAEIEYRGGITREHKVEMALEESTDGFSMWLLADGSVEASAKVRALH